MICLILWVFFVLRRIIDFFFFNSKSKTGMIYKYSTNVIYQFFNKHEEINLYMYIFLIHLSNQNRMKCHLLVFSY